jgi:aspartate/methionine/tyrosine aminotransferase
LKGCRDTLLPLLTALPRVTVAPPAGGLYAFLQIDGHVDSLALAKRLVVEAGLGLAPGVAFGPEAEGWLRWCFASRDPARLVDGVGRLERFLKIYSQGFAENALRPSTGESGTAQVGFTGDRK